jgi:hypothetical protein
MFDTGSDLSDVFRTLRHADDALTEFVAPWWAGVTRVAAWLEKRPQIVPLVETPEGEGYWYFATADGSARPLRSATPEEHTRYLRLLPRAEVILLEGGLAFPGSFAERLLGITGPHPIHFAIGDPLTRADARFDGLTLLYEKAHGASDRPLAGLLAGNSIFTMGEMLAPPDGDAAGGAKAALAALRDDPTQTVSVRLTALCAASGAELISFTTEGNQLSITRRTPDGERTAVLSSPDAAIAAGICLPGAATFDPSALTRALLQHAW